MCITRYIDLLFVTFGHSILSTNMEVEIITALWKWSLALTPHTSVGDIWLKSSASRLSLGSSSAIAAESKPRLRHWESNRRWIYNRATLTLVAFVPHAPDQPVLDDVMIDESWLAALGRRDHDVDRSCQRSSIFHDWLCNVYNEKRKIFSRKTTCTLHKLKYTFNLSTIFTLEIITIYWVNRLNSTC